MPDKDYYHVIMRFGAGIPASTQGEVMLDLEKALRKRGLPAEVYRDTMGDDSKLRRAMTVDQRQKL
jgi:predicted double-glycine peptidase